MILGFYTDGSCSSNPGPAGWGYIVTDESGTEPRIIYERYGSYIDEDRNTVHGTNQQAEMSACVYALKHACELLTEHSDGTVRIYSDSAYLLNCLKEKWYQKWSRNGWKTSTGDCVKNQWLWKKIIEYVRNLSLAGIKLEYIKVKGHSGHPLNERADVLANAGTKLSIEYFATENSTEKACMLT